MGGVGAKPAADQKVPVSHSFVQGSSPHPQRQRQQPSSRQRQHQGQCQLCCDEGKGGWGQRRAAERRAGVY